MGHLVREAQLLDRRRGVAAADDRNRAGFRDRLGDRLGADCEGVELEHAHRAVPDDRARVLDRVREQLDGLGADVHAHHVVRQLASLVNDRLGVRAEVVAAHGVDRQQELDALVRRLLDQAKRQIHLILLAQRGADRAALRLGEGVGHAAADDDGVALVDQVVDDVDLVRDLGAAQNGDERAGRVGKRLAHDGDLLLDQEAAHSRQIVGDAGGGGVRAVRGAERVVDEDVRHVGKRLGQRGVVLGLALFKAHVLEQDGLAGLDLGGELLRVLADDVLGELDLLAEQLGQALRDRRERILHIDLALRTAEVRAKDHSCIVIEQVLDGLERSADALVIGDVAVLVLRHVEVAAGNDLLARYVDILDALLVVLHNYPSPHKKFMIRSKTRSSLLEEFRFHYRIILVSATHSKQI